jgi:UTP:GlnB (protein PII) uridylyltransferase
MSANPQPQKRGMHPQVSAEMAMRAAKRLRLDESASHTLRLVIENHLLMASLVAAARP